jgi:hypothetical protein
VRDLTDDEALVTLTAGTRHGAALHAGLAPVVPPFFTGPGDPRPALEALDRRLRALGRPPASRAAWKRVLRARAANLRTVEAQDRAALASDVAAFVRTTHASSRAFRAVAIPATVFGAPVCEL